MAWLPIAFVTESPPVMAKLVEIVRTTVTAAMASAMPSTDRTNRSGRRRMFAIANRINRPNVPPGLVGRALLGSGEAITASVCFEVSVWLTISEAVTFLIVRRRCFADRFRQIQVRCI